MDTKEYLENYRARRKQNFSINITKNSWSDIDEIDISITTNGRQWSAISLTPNEVRQLHDRLTEWLKTEK